MAIKPGVYRAALSWPRKSRYLLISDHMISEWFGMNTVETDITKIPDGMTPDSLNWITGDDQECITLRRGTHLLGQTRSTGNGSITGLGIAPMQNGTYVPFFTTQDGRLKYYNAAVQDTAEVGSQIIPLAARNDQISILAYQNLAGYFCYVNSPNWDIVKIPTANPASYVLQGSTAYRGYMRFGQSRAMLWGNNPSGGSPDSTGLFMSNIDATTLTNLGTNLIYTGTTVKGSTAVSSMSSTTSLLVGMSVVGLGITPSTIISAIGSSAITLSLPASAAGSGVSLTFSMNPFPYALTSSEAVGSLGSTTYTHTLATVTDRKTCFQVQVTATVAAGTEIFTDNGNGVLASNFGGTGTVNYATGAISVTFSDVTTGAVTANYYTEDAASGGIVDFSIITTPASGSPVRIPGSGRYFEQFNGGSFQSVQSLTDVFYCNHPHTIYQITIPTDDDDTGTTPSTNLPYREAMGSTGIHGSYGAPEGVYFVNCNNIAKPQVFLLKPYTSAAATNTAIPEVMSAALNMTGYGFSQCVVFKFGWYLLICGAQTVSGVLQTFNSRMFILNTRSGAWDLLDCPSSVLADFNGVLLGGDPLTSNVWQLFTGFDDDGAIINNYWTSGYTHQGVTGQKTTQRMVVNGLIESSQNVKVEVSYDQGAFVEVFRILGTGNYVNTQTPISVGAYGIGGKVVGGGPTVQAFPFEVDFNLSSPRYEFVRVRFTACVSPSPSSPTPQGGGYVQINWYQYKLQKYKGTRSPQQSMQA